ncbi:hypothetical protein KCP78_10030 [Salmonella enterica subsp. enterica]|nr:hypothetical protein KCP78_10030 [Salmonella enterica subsp. enterica]
MAITQGTDSNGAGFRADQSGQGTISLANSTPSAWRTMFARFERADGEALSGSQPRAIVCPMGDGGERVGEILCRVSPLTARERLTTTTAPKPPPDIGFMRRAGG